MIFSFMLGVGTGVWIVNRYDTSKIKKMVEEKLNSKENQMKEVFERLQKIEKELKRETN